MFIKLLFWMIVPSCAFLSLVLLLALVHGVLQAVYCPEEE